MFRCRADMRLGVRIIHAGLAVQECDECAHLGAVEDKKVAYWLIHAAPFHHHPE
jgi:hypothetical protein